MSCSVASCTNDTGGFPAAAGSRLQPVFVRNIFATFQELPLRALFVHVRMHNPEERAGSSSNNGEFQSPITAALRHTVYRAKRTGQTLLGEATRDRLYLRRSSVSTVSCFRGHKPLPERIPDQSGLIAQAKFPHEVRPMALDSAGADG